MTTKSFNEAWDDLPSPSSSRTTVARRVQTTIPDDWDVSSDSETEAESTEHNQKLWNDAMSKAPMPELVIASSSTPTPAALAGPMRILKRPNSNTHNASPTTSSEVTLAQREARYQAARERIFGQQQPPSQQGRVLRNPLGPPETGQQANSGFGGRRYSGKKDLQD